MMDKISDRATMVLDLLLCVQDYNPFCMVYHTGCLFPAMRAEYERGALLQLRRYIIYGIIATPEGNDDAPAEIFSGSIE